MLFSLLCFGLAGAVSFNATEKNTTTLDVFPCDIPSISVRPDDVNRLAPGNVEIFASLGDSITAGFGLDSTRVITLSREWRGRAWTNGGEFPFEERVTVGSILRKYNPAIAGLSTGTGGPNSAVAKLNLAVSGAIGRDMPAQARALIDKLTQLQYDPKAWKLINIWIGGNDLCDVCNNNEINQPTAYIRAVQESIDTLRDQLTNVFVNLVLIMDVGRLEPVREMPDCVLAGWGCPCGTTREHLDVVSKAAQEMQALTLQLEQRYQDGRADFAVVTQPFFVNTQIPTGPDGLPDRDFFAPDCFHFSAMGHRAAAKALWKNMLEPVGGKTDKAVFQQDEPIRCPDPRVPYLRTLANSQPGFSP